MLGIIVELDGPYIASFRGTTCKIYKSTSHRNYVKVQSLNGITTYNTLEAAYQDKNGTVFDIYEIEIEKYIKTTDKKSEDLISLNTIICHECENKKMKMR